MLETDPAQFKKIIRLFVSHGFDLTKLDKDEIHKRPFLRDIILDELAGEKLVAVHVRKSCAL